MMKYLGTILLLICMLSSCHSSSSSPESYKAEASFADEKRSYALEEQEESQNQTDDLDVVERKIIKTAAIRFQVQNLKESTEKIEAITEKYSGLISSMNQRNSNYSINNSLTIRIPSEKMDAFISEIENESIHTNYTKINSQDVTEEYVDITSRLTTKKDVRDRYIEILRKKAKTVKDILDAEEKIRVIQEEIESIEGRLKYLKNKTSLSTINIEIYQEVEYVKSPKVYKKSFFTKLKEGFSDGWELIQEIAIGLVTIWPILLVLGILFFYRRSIKNFVRRGNKKA